MIRKRPDSRKRRKGRKSPIVFAKGSTFVYIDRLFYCERQDRPALCVYGTDGCIAGSCEKGWLEFLAMKEVVVVVVLVM